MGFYGFNKTENNVLSNLFTNCAFMAPFALVLGGGIAVMKYQENHTTAQQVGHCLSPQPAGAK